MSEMEILVNNRGYTEDAHAVCGEQCGRAVLYALGVSRSSLGTADSVRDYQGHPMEAEGGRTTVSLDVVSLGERDSDVFCAGCGDFLGHGLECGCAGKHDGEPRESLNMPGLDFRDAPRFLAWVNRDETAMAEFDRVP